MPDGRSCMATKRNVKRRMKHLKPARASYTQDYSHQIICKSILGGCMFALKFLCKPAYLLQKRFSKAEKK